MFHYLRPLVLLSLSACLISALAAAELKPINASKFKIKAKPSAGHSLADISGVHFFVTKNNGQTWKSVEAARIVQEDGTAPYFIFEANGDAAYGFWIQIHYADGSQDKAPVVGSVPPTVRLIDTTVPQIKTFNGGLIAGTENKLFLEWDVSDKHLSAKPVSIETSADQKSWTALAQGGKAAKGSDISSLPVELPFYVRLTAKDRAGNSSASKALLISDVAAKPTAVVKTETATAGTETAETTGTNKPAAAALPSLNEIEKDVDQELASKNKASGKKPLPRPVVPEGHQDIVAPYANKPWPGKYTGEEEPSTELVDPSTDPNQLAFIYNEDGTITDARVASRPLPTIIDQEIASILQRREGRILFGKDAEQVLAAARAAVISGNENRATVLFNRLTDSTVAIEALPEEVEFHLSLNHIDKAMNLVRTAPPEVMSTKMRVQEANLWLAKNKRSHAISILSGIIPDETSYYKNARLLLAQCFIDDKKLRSAKTILSQLAVNDDSWGQTAQQMLEQINN